MNVGKPFIVKTDVLYVLDKWGMHAVLQWTGKARWNDEHGMEEFLMRDADGAEIAVLAVMFQDLTEVPIAKG